MSPSPSSAQRSIILTAGHHRSSESAADDDAAEVEELQLNEEEEEEQPHQTLTDAETDIDLEGDDDDDMPHRAQHKHHQQQQQQHHTAAAKQAKAVTTVAAPKSSPPAPFTPRPPSSSPPPVFVAATALPPAAAPSAAAPRGSPPSSQRPSVSMSTSARSREVKEREQRVILPITAAPITRQNQDDTVIGIAPHHVDFDEETTTAGEEEPADDADDGDGREEIWYEEELDSTKSDGDDGQEEQDETVMEDDDDSRSKAATKRVAAAARALALATESSEERAAAGAGGGGGGAARADPFDREVSDIMSRTPSYSQQRQKELALVAAIKAEKERNPGQILASPPHSSSSSSAVSAASSPSKAGNGKLQLTPTFSYSAPNPYAVFTVSSSSSGGDKDSKGNTASTTVSDPSSASSSSPSSSASSSCCPSCCLLSSYAGSMLAALTFEFAAIVVLQHVFPSTLLPASLFGLLESVSNAIAPLLLSLLSRSLQADGLLFLCSTLQHLCVAGTCILLYLSLQHVDTQLAWLLLLPILSLCIIARVSFNLVRASAVVIATQAAGHRGLRPLSVVDNMAAVFGPLVFGAVATYSALEERAAILVVGGLSVIALPISMSTGCRSRTMPELQPEAQSKTAGKRKGAVKKSVKLAVQVAHTPDEQLRTTPTAISPPASSSPSRLASCLALVHHPSFLPSVAFGLLSTSMLCFSVDMIAFLSTQSVSDFALASGRSLSTIIGLLPPLCIDSVVRRLGSDSAGVISLWAQAVLLSPIIVIFVLTDRHSIGDFVTPLYLCLCFSSFSASTFRCIESPLVQRTAAASRPASASSSASSASAASSPPVPLALRVMVHLFIFFSCLLTVIFFNPRWFTVPVCISFACVVLAAIVYSLHGRRSRGDGHYVHIGGGGDASSEMVMMMGGKGEGEGEGEGAEGEDGPHDDVELEVEMADGVDADDEEEHRMDDGSKGSGGTIAVQQLQHQHPTPLSLAPV